MIPRCFMLKNGSTAVLRTAVPEDAAQMIAYLRACAEETDFLLRLPEEWDISVETEEALLRDMAHQTENWMLVCSVKGEIAGTCQVACMNRLKTRHRATVSIALRRAYWGQGISGVMFEEMEAFARGRGVMQLELAYAQGRYAAGRDFHGQKVVKEKARGAYPHHRERAPRLLRSLRPSDPPGCRAPPAANPPESSLPDSRSYRR